MGLNDSYDCTELAVAAFAPRPSQKDRLPLVIPPGDMHHWATILWDSGPVPQRPCNRIPLNRRETAKHLLKASWGEQLITTKIPCRAPAGGLG